MPLYEYACADCGEECEVLQKIHEPNPQICPNCGKPALQRVVSNFGTKLPGLQSRQELRKRLPKSQPQTNRTAVTHSHGPACGHSSGFSQRLKQYENGCKPRSFRKSIPEAIQPASKDPQERLPPFYALPIN